MFDAAERKELLKLLKKTYRNARKTLKKDAVLPHSITNNGSTCGVTISFHECRTPVIEGETKDEKDAT